MTDILSKDNGHFLKITAIYSLKQVACAPINEPIVDKLIGIIYKSLTDPVPNIRLVAIKTLR
jgi:hypothetical protein